MDVDPLRPSPLMYTSIITHSSRRIPRSLYQALWSTNHNGHLSQRTLCGASNNLADIRSSTQDRYPIIHNATPRVLKRIRVIATGPRVRSSRSGHGSTVANWYYGILVLEQFATMAFFGRIATYFGRDEALFVDLKRGG